MKKILLTISAILTLCLGSCMPRFSDRFYYLDYSRFTEKGFFITEAPTVPFDYLPVGSVVLVERSGKKEITAVHKPGYDGIYGEDNSVTTKSKYEYASSGSAMEALYEFAKENNADGIINFNVTSGNENGLSVTISGMLIKRK